MQVDIPYGKEKITVTIDKPCEILVPNKVLTGDESKLIEEALRNPIGFQSYDEFANDTDKLLVIVNFKAPPPFPPMASL